MTRKFLLAAILLVVHIPPLVAAPAYEPIRALYLDNTRKLWFAIGCGVVDEQSTGPLFRSMQIGLANALYIANGVDWHESGSGLLSDPQLLPMIQKARREGIGMANDTAHHVCDYWRTNPNAAARIKQVVSDAANGIPP
jgi:hypothetical protein